MTAQQIFSFLIKQGIKGQQGIISFNLANISFSVESKDIIGGVLQEWFENWLLHHKIPFTKPDHAQEYPDFYLENYEHLEIKAFNHLASPAFDIGNFDAYTRSLLTNPERLDAEHLIFSYLAENRTVEIKDIWLRKVWQMTGASDKNCLNLQVKQNVPVNIRPKDWRGKAELFSCRRDFVLALNNALIKFYPERYEHWFTDVEQVYYQKTGYKL